MLFDRSWYNRAGVERVMEFCTEEQCEEFFRSVPDFERMLVRAGILLIKYWFSITDEEQQFRFLMRIHDPLKQWKLSPMDVQSRARWERYTRAKEEMLQRTHIPEARWWVVEAVDKKGRGSIAFRIYSRKFPMGMFIARPWCSQSDYATQPIIAKRSPLKCMSPADIEIRTCTRKPCDVRGVWRTCADHLAISPFDPNCDMGGVRRLWFGRVKAMVLTR